MFTLLFLSCHKDATVDVPTAPCRFADYHFYSGTVLDMSELSNDYVAIGFDTTYSEADMRRFVSTINYFDQNFKYTIYDHQKAALKFTRPMSCEEISGIIAGLLQNPIVEYASYAMKTNSCQAIIIFPPPTGIGNVCVNTYSDEFFVDVFDANNLTDLNKMITETKTELVSQDPLRKRSFILRATKNSKGDGLQMASYFNQSNLFATVDPGVFKLPVE